MFRKLAAEAFGTFWLVFGGCGSAVLAASFPELGIGFTGVALAFGLTVLTMAYTVGGISGGHFNPAVSLGLAVSGRFSWNQLGPYWLAQVLGGILGAIVLYAIATGKADFTAGGFASNGYGVNSPGGYGLRVGLPYRVRPDRLLPHHHPRIDGDRRVRQLRADRDRPWPDADPPHLDPGHQHVGQPRPIAGRRLLRRYRCARSGLAVLGRAAGRRRGRCPDLAPYPVAGRVDARHRRGRPARALMRVT
ncbi:Major intrinsic protein [Aureimonas phyllosphaerae]|nr:Major intrinsic protein [Aureimonas phyllosphaerae]